MSVSHPERLKFRITATEPGELEGPLNSSYDEQADILYLWLGRKPREAISVTSIEGHLIRLDPDSHEVVGLTIFDFCRRWQEDDPGGGFQVTIPNLGESEGGVTAAKQLELVAG